MNDIDDNSFFRLIANHECLKHKNKMIKNDYLKLYIQSKFDTDLYTTNNLINHIENIVNNIKLEEFIVKEVLNKIVHSIENGSLY
jgi:hypothetical protein